jgi:integrase/recombinase XerD
MLTIYRRHKRNCEHRSAGRRYRRCQCPIWVDGLLGSKELRESLKCRDWQRAQDLIRDWEARGQRVLQSEPQTIEAAFKEFLADIGARKLHASTVSKYTRLQRQLEEFARNCGFQFLNELDLVAVSRFRSQWKDGPRSSAKKLERLRAFFRFAQDRKWAQENPASRLKSPKVTLCPTLPYTREEIVKILAAIGTYTDEMPSSGLDNARRMLGLVLLLRYTGMRIGDAVNLSSDRIAGNRLFLYTQKTGVPVNAVLPEIVVAAIEATPKVNEKYFFWSGVGKLDSAVRSWQTRLRKLFELAKIPGGHAHRVSRHFRCRVAPGRHSDRASLHPTRTSECAHHGETLFTMG